MIFFLKDLKTTLANVCRELISTIKQNVGLYKTVRRKVLPSHHKGLDGIDCAIRATDCHIGDDYQAWILKYDPPVSKIKTNANLLLESNTFNPLISIIMPIDRPRLDWLEAAIDSVCNQSYPYWELSILYFEFYDQATRQILERYVKRDSRIKVFYESTTVHTPSAYNFAVELALGKWIALFDSSDLLNDQALYLIADSIIRNSEIGLIYSDMDKLDESNKRHSPYFKCDWNLDLFYSYNFISHLSVYRSDIIQKLGGFRDGFDHAFDYDLALRSIELLKPEQIHHIPRVLYHQRTSLDSTKQSMNADLGVCPSGVKALNEHLQRLKIKAKAIITDCGYRLLYDLPDHPPLVSIIIPTRNGLELIRTCIHSIIQKTTYPNYEILIIDNLSDDPSTIKYLKEVQKDKRISVVRDDHPFNYSALNNLAVKIAKGEIVGLLNNDLEVISPEWLSEMVSIALQPKVGAVGARLWYPNNTLQHGGVILGIGGVAGHSHKYIPRGGNGYFGRASCIQSFSAVTAACLVIRKETYIEVGGLNEVDLQVAFNDIDFCLRVRDSGCRNVWTPFAELFHHESATRGDEDNYEKKSRFKKEIKFMKHRWRGSLLNDPAYSPNLTLYKEDFSLAWGPRVKKLRPERG